MSDYFATRTLQLIRLSDEEPKEQTWLLKDWIPMGCLTLIGGGEGSGKSTYTVDIAARISTGTLEGYFHGQPKSVLVYSTEDDVNRVLWPRFKAAGADMTKIFILEAKMDEFTDSIDMREDEEAIRKICNDENIGVIILDPIKSSLGDGVDQEKDRQLRRALEPINWLAQQTNTSVLGIIHYNKRETTDPRMLISGLRTWSAVARAVLGVIPHPNNSHEILIGVAKSNYGAQPDHCRRGKITTTDVRHKGKSFPSAKIMWLSDEQGKLDDHLAAKQEGGGRQNQVVDWLQYLFLRTDRVPSAEMDAGRKEHGFSEKLVRKVRNELGIIKDPGKGGEAWSWIWPDTENNN